jgi:acyl-CoA thioesterase
MFGNMPEMSDRSQPPAAVTAMMAADQASRALGIELLECEPGRALATVTVREDMANGYAIAHGGVVFTLADTAFACACNGHGAVTVRRGADVIAEFRGRSHRLAPG